VQVALERRVDDPPAVGRPDGGLVRNGAKRKPGLHLAGYIVHPDVVRAGAVVNVESDAVGLRGQLESFQIGKLLDHGRELFCVAVHPNQLLIARPAIAEDQQPVAGGGGKRRINLVLLRLLLELGFCFMTVASVPPINDKSSAATVR
jgi:hypothetical protein